MDVSSVAQALGAVSGILMTFGLVIAVFALARRNREHERRIVRLEQAMEQAAPTNRPLDSATLN